MAVNNVKFLVSAKDTASKTLNKVWKNITGLQWKLSKFGPALKKAWIWFAALWTAAFLAWKEMVSLANDQIRVETALDAVLKSTQNAAGLTAESIKDMASELQNVTTIWDEAIIAGQNMLLTFTNIWKEAFKPTTEIMLDMATALNSWVTPSAEQLKTQAIALWKALNDPIKWVTALSRVWVAFTDDQKKMITTLQESWDILWAQKIILAELWKEFWGQARAQAETFEGQMQQLSNTIWDTKEVIWMALIPALQEAMTSIRPIIDAVNEWILANPELTANILKWAVALGLLSAWIFAITTIFGPLLIAVKALWVALSFLAANPIWLVIVAIAAWIAIWILLVKNWDLIKTTAINVFTAIWAFISKTIETIKSKFEEMGLLWDFLRITFEAIALVFTAAFEQIKSIFWIFVSVFKWDWEWAWNWVKDIFENTWNLITDLVSLFLEWIALIFSAVWEWIKAAFMFQLDLMLSWASAFFKLLKTWFMLLMNWIKLIWTTWWNFVKDFASNTLNNIVSFFTWFGPTLKNWFSSMFSWIGDIAKNIFNWIVTTIEWFINRFISLINTVITAANKVPWVDLDRISSVSIWRLAHGWIAWQGTFWGQAFQSWGVVTWAAGIDKVPALLSAWEVVLNAAQQSTLANQLNRGDGLKSVNITISWNSFFWEDEEFIEKIWNTLLDKFSASTAFESF